MPCISSVVALNIRVHVKFRCTGIHIKNLVMPYTKFYVFCACMYTNTKSRSFICIYHSIGSWDSPSVDFTFLSFKVATLCFACSLFSFRLKPFLFVPTSLVISFSAIFLVAMFSEEKKYMYFCQVFLSA